MLATPTEYQSHQTGAPRTVQIAMRSGVDEGVVDRSTESLAEVRWHEVHHAYGLATNVPALLLAIVVGTDEVRSPAWWELWGNIHHQGTAYEATARSVPFIEAVAGSLEHPDGVEALSFLRQIVVGNGTCAAAVRAAVRPGVEASLANWEMEPDLIQRALSWLASVYPDLASLHPGLEQLVPESMRSKWAEVVTRSGYPIAYQDESTDDAMDRQAELERWVPAGWPRS